MASALDLINLHQLPVAIAQPAESVYQQLPAFVYMPAAAASLHSAADIHPSAVSSSVEPKISTCLLLWEQFMIGEAQLQTSVQRAFLSSGLQLSKACQHKSGGSLSCAE